MYQIENGDFQLFYYSHAKRFIFVSLYSGLDMGQNKLVFLMTLRFLYPLLQNMEVMHL